MSDISAIQALGWQPTIPVEQNAREYLEWMERYEATREYLEEAERIMREQNVLREVRRG